MTIVGYVVPEGGAVVPATRGRMVGWWPWHAGRRIRRPRFFGFPLVQRIAWLIVPIQYLIWLAVPRAELRQVG